VPTLAWHSAAIVAVSLPGSRLGLRLRRGLPGSVLWLPERFSLADEAGVVPWRGQLADLVAELFERESAVVIIGAVGMAVRLIAPLVRDKRTDPAVVVVDDSGRFAVSLLSGHLGGANSLAERVAQLLGACPVITTGSEVLDTLAVDLLGRELGWRIENPETVTQVSAALVNGEPVGLVQEAGEPDWWPVKKPFPTNLLRLSTLEELKEGRYTAGLIISDRELPDLDRLNFPIVLFRPGTLVVGIGCNRGTGAEEIEAAVRSALKRNGLAMSSLRKLATVDIKRNEIGLLDFARKLGVTAEYFPAEELDAVVGVPNPSSVVHGWVGSMGVCEPAALLASGMGTLIVPKTKTYNVTVAVARVRRSESLHEERLG
jgi:cobalt-precorrin 5A hydrolase